MRSGDKGVDIGKTWRGVISVPHKEFAILAEPKGAVQMVSKVIGNREEIVSLSDSATSGFFGSAVKRESRAILGLESLGSPPSSRM